MKTYTLVDEQIKQVNIIDTGINSNVKSISYYGNDGLEKRTFRNSTELFTNKAKAVKYFKS